MGRVDENAPGIALACSFCGRSQHEVRKLIAGPGAYICDACVGVAGRVVSTGNPATTPLGPVRAVPDQEARAWCPFCGKPRDQVPGLAAMPADAGRQGAGPTGICSECLVLCRDILAEELA